MFPWSPWLYLLLTLFLTLYRILGSEEPETTKGLAEYRVQVLSIPDAGLMVQLADKAPPG